VREEKETCLEEDSARVAALSRDGEVQFRAFINLGAGFARKGSASKPKGFWIPKNSLRFC
jgi:hypothetical protein